jgi:hypothetical protein
LVLDILIIGESERGKHHDRRLYSVSLPAVYLISEIISILIGIELRSRGND